MHNEVDACRSNPAGERRSVTSKAKAEEYFNRISDGINMQSNGLGIPIQTDVYVQ